ncbi:response regulator transcription factor [Mucilaginibacter sp. HD30]
MEKILVIDNDPAILDIMQEALGYEGFEVTVVEETQDICKLVKAIDPQLVVIDYMLNGINGGELCHQIKSFPETDKLPVILFSAYPRVFNSLGTYGCDAFIAKPFDLSHLIDQVQALIKSNTNKRTLGVIHE